MTATQVLIVAAIFAVPVTAPVIAAELGMDASRVGLFTGLVFGISIWSTVIGGNAAARFGGVRVGQVCLVLAAVALVMAIMGTWWAFAAAAILLGLGMGPETPASSHLLARVVPRQRQPRLFSIRQTGSQIGAIAASLFVPAMTALAGWRVGLAAIAALCLVYAGALELDRRALKHYDVDASPPRKRRIIGSLRLMLASIELRRLAAAAVTFGAMQVCLNGFMVSYLVADLALDLISAGIVLAVAQAGGLIGRVGWGLVVERLGRVTPVLIAVGFAMSLSSAGAAGFSAAWPRPALFGVAFVFGLTASGWNGVFLAEAARLAPDGRVGEVTGAISMLAYVGLVLGPLVFTTVVAVGLGYGGAYLVLACFALLGTLALLAPRITHKERG